MGLMLERQYGNLETLTPLQRRRALFSLPFEISQRIFFHALHPKCRFSHANSAFYVDEHHPCDSRNTLGCTKVLQLCKASYSEAIVLLHHSAVICHIKATRGKLFRYEKAIGTPSFFHSKLNTSKFFVPQQFTQLEVLRLRHIAVQFQMPHWFPSQGGPRPAQRTELMEAKARKLATVLERSQALESLRIPSTTLPVMVSVLNKRARNIGTNFDITGELTREVRLWEAREQKRQDVERELEDALTKWKADFMSGVDNEGVSGYTIDVDDRGEPHTSKVRLPTPVNPSFEEFALVKEDSNHFELQPECRCCLKVFYTKGALTDHLASNP
jgi:hypothetical protein